MSDYTSNSGFEKPVPGTQAGTWGGTVNTNMDLVDEAINGIVTITLTAAGTSGSPNTMQITDGATSPARHAFIEVDDDAFGTDQDVYLQLTETAGTVNAERICWIKNSMSSGNDLYLFQGNHDVGREYVVPQGQTCLVRFTGGGSVTNCYVYNVLENTYVEGTFTAVGNITGLNLSGTNTGDNPGVTEVDTSGALSGGPITGTGTITHLNTDGYKHIPSGGTPGQFVENTAAGSGSWVTLTVAKISDYQIPAMYDDSGTPTLQAGITAAEYRTAIGAGTSDTTGTVTSVTGGSGLTGSVTTSGSLAVGPGQGIVVNADDVALDYAGANNFIRVATDLEGSAISISDTIIYSDATDGNIKKGLISDLPGIGSAGTVTSVTAGNGMDFTEITGTGSVTMGTPGSITDTSTNSTTATSHTHAVSHTGTGDFVMATSPVLAGTPTAPTQTVGNNSTRIATTAFVNAEIANDAPLKDGTGATGTWGIDITGNASTAGSATSATSATTAVTVTGASQTAITSVGTLASLTTSGLITGDSSVKLKEIASALGDTAAYGQIWVKTATPNQLWFTNDAGADIRLDVASGGTVTSVTGGNGLSGTVTTSGNIDVDYSGSDNIIMATSDDGANLSTSDWLLYSDATDNGVHRCNVSDLPFTNNAGDITSVTVDAGNGLLGGGTDSSGSAIIPDIYMGTPSTLTDSTTNAVTASSHTHEVTFPVPTLIGIGSAPADSTMYPMLSGSTSGQVAPKSDTGLVFNSTTNALTVSGTVNGAVLNATSARHMKNEVSRIINTHNLRAISQQGIIYTLKDDTTGKIQMGYYADEISPYFPEIVSYGKDGVPSGMDYSRLVVPLIEKVIELEDRMEEMIHGN